DRPSDDRPNRRAAWPGYHEAVRKAISHEAEISNRPVRPLVLQRNAALAHQTCLQNCPGARVETGRHDNHVKIVGTAAGPNPGRGDLDNRILLNVDEMNAGIVVDLKIPIFDKLPTRADIITPRLEHLCDLRIGYP